MQEPVKETLCTRCKNRMLCKYINQFIDTQTYIDKVLVEHPHEVVLKCQYHVIDSGNIR